MGPTWVLPAPGGSHVGPMNLAISQEPLSIRLSSHYAHFECNIVLALNTLSLIESTKSTSMEDVSTGVVEKNLMMENQMIDL